MVYYKTKDAFQFENWLAFCLTAMKVCLGRGRWKEKKKRRHVGLAIFHFPPIFNPLLVFLFWEKVILKNIWPLRRAGRDFLVLLKWGGMSYPMLVPSIFPLVSPVSLLPLYCRFDRFPNMLLGLQLQVGYYAASVTTVESIIFLLFVLL